MTSPEIDEGGRSSPDGRWIAYHSLESGDMQVYVQPFPPNGSKWQISLSGGRSPVWSRDGKALYFIDPTGKINEAAVTAGPAFAAQQAQPLFSMRRREGLGPSAQFDVLPDGTFITNSIPDTATSTMTLVVNWRDTLAK